jgi:hemin uptake protein HemP
MDPADRNADVPAGRRERQLPPAVGPSPTRTPAVRAAAPVIHSADLLQGGGEVHILHNGETYRLTVTRAGKLILHK